MKIFRNAAKQIRYASYRFIYPRLPGLHNAIFFRLRRKLARIAGLQIHTPNRSGLFFPGFKRTSAEETYKPLISIVVPCYNHAPYLEERLKSIEQQTYQNFELILLDDASSDGSQQILEAARCRNPERTKLVINDKNSGTAFRQWARGLSQAKGDLVWIAESDDTSDTNFLEELVPFFKNRAVMLAMARTVFVDQSGSAPVWSIEDYLPEFGFEGWSKPFIAFTHQLVLDLWSRRNILPNASSCIFRRPTEHRLLDQPWWQSLSICGDWLFYLELCRCGLVGYTPKTKSYYRQHTSNSSVSRQKQKVFFDEHLLTAQWVTNTFRLTNASLTDLQEELFRRWPTEQLGPMSTADIEKVRALSQHKPGRPNILIVTYALIGGGGEVFPLRLANSLRAAGYGVAVLSCDQKPKQPAVEAMVNSDVPIYTLERLQELGHLVLQLDLSLVHSHHAWVDTLCAELLSEFSATAHVVTSHGMYDYMDANELKRIGNILRPRTKTISYVSETNRKSLLQLGFTPGQLRHIPNAVPSRPIQPVDRISLGIDENSFVLCLVSRAMEEKGWREAIAATELLRKELMADVHLLLIGEGKLAEQLKVEQQHASYIHLLGFRANTLDYFAGSDLGLLPTRFSGESQPLTLIECLIAGTPYIATRIGQIEAMLSCGGEIAGSLIDLENGHCSPRTLANAIMPFVLDRDLLQNKKSLTAIAAKRFSWPTMVEAYEEFYEMSYHNLQPQVVK